MVVQPLLVLAEGTAGGALAIVGLLIVGIYCVVRVPGLNRLLFWTRRGRLERRAGTAAVAGRTKIKGRVG